MNAKSHPPEQNTVQLVGEGTTPERLAIREFKHLEPTGPYSRNHRIMTSKLAAAFNDNLFNTAKSVWHDQSVDVVRGDFNDFTHTGAIEQPILAKLKTHLISPKIVTGDIARLAIAESDETSLPTAMMNGFRRINTSSRRDREIEGYDDYYTVFGELKLGRSLAKVACGICITPYVKVSSYSAEGQLSFRTQVTPFAIRDREELRLWQDSIDAVHRREADGMNRPWSGGLVNPR